MLGVEVTMLYQVLFDENDQYGVAYRIKNDELFTLPSAGKVKKWEPVLLE